MNGVSVCLSRMKRMSRGQSGALGSHTKPRETIKRNKSFKGTMRPMLMGFDHDEWHHQVIGKRSTSPKDTKKREGAIRKTVHHF